MRTRKVTRRRVLGATGAAALGLAVPGLPVSAAERESGRREARSDAHPGAEIKQSVARWCFEEIPLRAFCSAVSRMGLPAIDLLAPDEWAVARDHDLIVSCGDVGAGTIEDGLNEPRNHSGIIRAFDEFIPRAAREGVPSVICFFGNRRGMDDGSAIANSIRCLRECAPIAESQGVTILVEALNSKPGGHVDYIGDRMSYALEIVRAVDSPRVRILYDIYHMQIMEGDIVRTLTDARDWIGHYHTGGVPGRGEIDENQELNYAAIVRAIRATGFGGFIAHEFIPKRQDALRSLREAMDLCARA